MQNREKEQAWIREQLAELEKPKTLTERNWVQIMLAERHQVEFGGTVVESLVTIAKPYAAKFPQWQERRVS